LKYEKCIGQAQGYISCRTAFLLPLLILLVIITKVFSLLTGITGKIAAMFGMKSVMGVSGGTIVSGLSLILICFGCGYLMRLSLFKFLNKYLDKKLAQNLPGYQAYHDMARSKLDNKEEALPYKGAAWIKLDEKVFEPAFIMEEGSSNNFVSSFLLRQCERRKGSSSSC
jgi:hypothetical protein